MAFNPLHNRRPDLAIGNAEDAKATNTTDAWSMISLLKAIFDRLTSGIAVSGSQVDDTAFTPGTSPVQPAAATYRGTRDSVDDGDAGALAMTAKRGLLVVPETPNGDSLVDETNDRLNVGLIASQPGIDGGSGAASVKTVRVIAATDSPELALLTAIAAYVDGLEALTTAMSAKLPATLGQKTAANSLAVVVASDDPVATSAAAQVPAATATISTVNSAATSAQALAANSSRKMATFHNTDANACLLKYGTTASATSFTVRIPAGGYFEMPRPIYTGRIDAIWEADGSGSLIITEY